MKRSLRILPPVLWSLLLASCIPLGSDSKRVGDLFTQWGEEDARLNQALGERVYDKDFDVAFSAVVTSLSDMGFAVKNMERQSGYILAEGLQPLPKDQELKLGQMMCDEINKVSFQRWVPRLGNATKSVTISVLRLGDQKTKLKMRIANTAINGGANTTRYQEEYPPILQAEYQFIWRGLEKQIFLDENLDKIKH